MQSIEQRKPLRDVDYPMDRLDEPEWRIYEMCRKGLIPHVRLGRRYKFDPEKLERWIESGGTGLEDGRLSAQKRKRAFVKDTPSSKDKSTTRRAGREVL